MARPYTITINNGTGITNVLSGSYDVESSINGYDNTTINPSSVVIDKTTATYNFTINSTGTFTLHVSEEGTSPGTSVVGATFIRCDFEGNEYGTIITSNSEGNAVFNNVPYAIENSPIVYYKQKASDGEHEFDETLKNITLTQPETTFEIQNALPLTRTINLTDGNYSGLPISAGQITLS